MLMVDYVLKCVVVLSERMIGRVKMCEIRSEIYGASDHCPIVLEIAPRVAS
jgi:AP endonuclease-1